VLVNGNERNEESFRRLSAYVLQDDLLYPHLTVLETLSLASHFYLPTSMDAARKAQLVENVINELGLAKVRHSRIGSTSHIAIHNLTHLLTYLRLNVGNEKVRGISGGERKRANIATQLISDPYILFLDEPTSGLDSFQALSVMQCIKDMATTYGRMVISVVHQPRSSIYDMFDQLLLLSSGRVMYLGPAKQSVLYFAELGHICGRLVSIILPLHNSNLASFKQVLISLHNYRNTNPSAFFLDILSPDYRSPEAEAETTNRIETIGDKWQENKHRFRATSLSGLEVADINTLKVAEGSMDLMRIFTNYKMLSWRSWSEQYRDLATIKIKLIMTSFFALIIGGIYSDAGYSQKAINNRVGLLFVICINQGFNGVIGVLNAFPKEKVIVNRERSNNAYDTFTYFTAKYLVEMPLNTLPCVWFTCILYYIVGLNPHTFGYCLLILMLEALTAVSLGLAVSAIAPNADAASFLGPPMVIIALLFGGFYINVSSLPTVANLIPYLSFLKWAFEALCINEFTGETFTCSISDTSCTTKGEDVLRNLSFSESIYKAVFGLGMVLLGFTVSAFYLLDRSKVTYIPLNFMGAKYKKYTIEDTKTTTA